MNKSSITKKSFVFIWALALFFTVPKLAYGMHIAEGFLPMAWCAFYFVACVPFVALGIRDIRKKTMSSKDLKMLLALIGAFAFVLSAMKLPSVTGSSSHPTGTGLGAMIFGPFAMSVVSIVVLLFQALFLAHGGLTTLGANVLSMGIAGPIVAFAIYKVFKNKNKKLAIFLGATLGDLATYLVTSIQLGLAFPATTGGFAAAFIKFVSIFAITQVPLAVVEGIITVMIFDFIEKHASEELLEVGGVR
ncbi:cobalamin biosynthesis protein CbiM [Clostridium sulfidigenes]|uniref:Cobalt transport protein CbiM n=1 Tax=Clostridium sulfidigenes TaxID=318464 RepID=A0A084JHQ7_9CLOT|nr:energy-coupling factor ABC transporter permease [Clostridium sulfidigenes]KEZ88491.1 cobalamin biosynthesis protein CbiM [Clostridium sulfidigenes]